MESCGAGEIGDCRTGHTITVLSPVRKSNEWKEVFLCHGVGAQ